MVKNLPAVQETQVQSLGRENLMDKGMATHPSILAWRFPWTEESGGLQSIGSQTFRHDWVTSNLYLTSSPVQTRNSGLWRSLSFLSTYILSSKFSAFSAHQPLQIALLPIKKRLFYAPVCSYGKTFPSFVYSSISLYIRYICVYMFFPCYWHNSMLVAQSYATFATPPGSSVHGVLQARILEWVAIPFFRRSSWLREWIWILCLQNLFIC